MNTENAAASTDSEHEEPTIGNPRNIASLLEVMKRLRDPLSGCPWDIEQDFESIAPYTVEEAYEVQDAIARNNMADLREELGDLLFQAVFHSQMAKEQGSFTFDDVVETITTKMIRRHPHIFANETERSSEEQTKAWEDIKAKERDAKGHKSVLDDVPVSLPGLTRAVKLQKRAARIGFDWPSIDQVLDKLHEETGELNEAMAMKDKAAIEDEFGDLLFVMANLARHLKIDPEEAIRKANLKFSKRFKYVEEHARAHQSQAGTLPALDVMEEWWINAKRNLG